MKPLYNREGNPTTQEVFDRLYYYFQEGNRLSAAYSSCVPRAEKKVILSESRLLRKLISNEYKEMDLDKNSTYYEKDEQTTLLYLIYKESITDMNKFADRLNDANISDYLYDVSDYATTGLYNSESKFNEEKIDTKGFFSSLD